MVSVPVAAVVAAAADDDKHGKPDQRLVRIERKRNVDADYLVDIST